MRRPHRYVASGDTRRVFSDPAYKFSQLETIRNYLRRTHPAFKATVNCKVDGNNYLYTISLSSPKSVSPTLLQSIKADLQQQDIRVDFADPDAGEEG